MIIEAWNPPMFGGGQVHAEKLCEELVNRGYAVDVYTRDLERPIKSDIKPYNVIHCGSRSTYNSYYGRLTWIFDVLKIARKQKYDIIHAQANLGGIPGKLLSMMTKTPVIFTVHGSGINVWDEMQPGFMGKINQYVETFIQTKIRYTKVISVDSKFLQIPNVNKDIKVIRNGVDLDAFDSVAIQKSKQFTFVFVGRLCAQKGLKYLIKAMQYITKVLELKQARVIIVGDGDDYGKLTSMALLCGLHKYLFFEGRLHGTDLIKAYKSTHCFILPSVFEGQPLTILEASAAKLPIICTDVGENKAMFNEGFQGWLVKPGSAVDLSRAMLAAMSTRSLRKMGKQNYELVKKYTWEKMVDHTIKVYQDAATNN